MELCTFAVDDGFAEALVRGQRLSLLKEQNYEALKQFNNLNDFKAYLEDECNYEGVWDNTIVTNVTDTTIKRGLEQCLADEFTYFERNSIAKLNKFMWYLRCPYMIDNTISMIEGIKNNKKDEDSEANLHPLGMYPELKNIKVEKEDTQVLFETVLVESPLAEYFWKLLESNKDSQNNIAAITGYFKERHAEMLRAGLKKFWIEDFTEFCETLNGISRDNMLHILKTEADFMTINTVYNTLRDEKKVRENIRRDLLPACGYFYPDCHQEFLTGCDKFDDLKAKCVIDRRYQDIVNDIADPTQENQPKGAPSIDD